ncbi:MAG TPA: hypothetical protein VFE62_16205 [Gemmataceae bacterium]|nr:hypothetical protein [Gemmataceae bacterium]
MSVNLVVWSWSKKFDTPAKRRKLQINFSAIREVWAETGDHPSMGDFDFADFLTAVADRLGKQKTDGPYILERYPRSLCFNLPSSKSQEFIPIIGGLARKFGLNAAEF